MRIDRTQAKRLIFTALVFAISTTEICLLHKSQWLLTSLLVLTTVVTLIWSWERYRTMACYVFGAILGPFGEILAVRHGAWSYPDPMCLGIPVYLPFAWGLIVVVIIGMSECVAACRPDRST